MDYWKQRMQKLTNITEQVRDREVKFIVQTVTLSVKNPGAADGLGKTMKLLAEWKDVDVRLTEAANEAKDNEKYLRTLETFIEPIDGDSIIVVMDTLPALLNSIKMIHTIARYYSSDERMENLFFKITNGMIQNCRRCINNIGGTETSLWDLDLPELRGCLEQCLELNQVNKTTESARVDEGDRHRDLRFAGK